jgi:hypothetical protein
MTSLKRTRAAVAGEAYDRLPVQPMEAKAGMANEGNIYHSDHSVPPGVSWETHRFMIQLLDCHGAYA